MNGHKPKPHPNPIQSGAKLIKILSIKKNIMQTTIKKNISVNQIEKVFDLTDHINIRWYQPSKKQEITDFDAKIGYDITIRHNEDEDPKELLNNAISKIK